MTNSIIIHLLIILLTIHGVMTLRGESSPDVRFSEFVVSIWYFHEHRCSGSILDKTHILTAGHCVHGLSDSLLSVAAGIITFNPRNIQKVPVEMVHLHPDFGAACRTHHLHWENDIAILELSEELQWVSTVAAVSLITIEYNWYQCDSCGLYGWDDATVDGTKLLTLRWSPVLIIEDRECRDMNVYLSVNTKCAISEFGTIVLEDVRKTLISSALHLGDHGGPVMCGGEAVGMLIGGGHSMNNPPVFLSLYPYLRFIANILHVRDINIPFGNFQYYVAILYHGSYICGGSIIDSTHILTAAHCVESTVRASVIVIAGETEIEVGNISKQQAVMIFKQQSLIDHIEIHPEYEHNTKGTGKWKFVKNDIAVLTLKAPLEWSYDIKAIPLLHFWPFGKQCQVYRWSRTITPHGNTLLKAKWSSAQILSPDTCRRINPFLDSNRFCTVNLFALPIATQGDSGSPIICGGFLVGILSSHTSRMRLPDGPNQLLFFTAVLPYFDFIKDQISGTVQIP